MKQRTDHQPPKWAFKLLRYFLKDKYLDEIEGDMEEVFNDNVDQHSLRKAKWIFIWDVFKLIRPSLIKNQSTTYYPNSMIRNNLKISLRVFNRNKSYTFINVLGMSTGLAIAMLIMLYVRFELSYEKDNPLADRLVRVTVDYLNAGTLIDQDAQMYHPFGPLVSTEFSEVEDFTRVFPIHEATVKIGDEFFREGIINAVDSSFLTLFNRPLLHGNSRNIFKAPYEVVITESQALKYFKQTNVVGESLWISTFNKDFKIVGVVPESPANTHLKSAMLISYPSLKATFSDRSFLWNDNSAYTYLLLTDPGQYNNFLMSLANLNERLHKENKILNERIVGQRVEDIHLYSNKSYEAEQNGDATSVFILLSVAILVMVIAIVNYINLSTSKALDRAKEVGIRKVVGSSLRQLRTQFFTESFLLNLFAGIFAVALMIIAFPSFRNMAGLPSDFHFWNDVFFWGIMILAILMITLLSGTFPALVLSSFQPMKVLKGKFSQSGRGMILRKALIVFQFSITIFLLIQTFTAERQLNYMREKNLGLDAEHTVVVRAPGSQTKKNNQLFKDQLLAHTQFQAVTLSSCVPGQPSNEISSTTGINLVGAAEKSSFNFYVYFTDADFIPAMRMSLAAGENFLQSAESPDKILVNEEAIKLWGFTDAQSAIGKKIEFWSSQFTIIGVIRNFHQASAKTAYIPMVFLHTQDHRNLASIRLRSGNTKEDLELIKKLYTSAYPTTPFDYFFLDQEFDKQYRADEQFGQVFGTLTAFAIVIACLGLFGLVSFTVANRTKEIGVRKVLGANIMQVITLLSKDFVSLILMAIVISVSVTYFLIQNWLEKYAFRIELNVWLFIMPAIGVLIVSLLTIFLRTFQVSSVNPVNSLRDE